MEFYRKTLKIIERIELATAMALFVVIVLSITLQVISRYGFGRPFVWVEELATYSFIWIVFLGAAAGMKRLAHIKIEAASLLVSVRVQALMRLFGYAVMLFVLYWLVVKAPGVMSIEARSNSISLPIPISRMWFYSMPLFYASLSMVLTLAFYTVADIVALIKGEPMTYINGESITDFAREGI
ncbi:TRAP transporter small permease [Halomonas sp. KO116]|uniref:TRAP transporter small permease n=1 Tax=Halomonas sp. KO116 TaxID=1504981 RepID=UPI0004E38562|nr:TRAP transporter small permease [Halomonas sp. KO116]AJY49337.1 Tripartite ATP-independent periplasmic transporter DctQ component [Halomonas sp. KO116]